MRPYIVEFRKACDVPSPRLLQSNRLDTQERRVVRLGGASGAHDARTAPSIGEMVAHPMIEFQKQSILFTRCPLDGQLELPLLPLR